MNGATATILVVDDEKLIRWTLRDRLRAENYQVTEAADGASAVRLLKSNVFDLALVDLRLPDMEGIQVLKEARSLYPDLPVLIITAYSSVETAIDAMKAGAYDYVGKPFNLDTLVFSVRRALEAHALRQTVHAEIDRQRRDSGLAALVGESPALRAVKELARRVAESDSTSVLLLGETGTGKDLLARAIHYESARAQRPFINIMCTNMPAALVESELFGHEEGAFTDARSAKTGLLELAHRGTAFLDEIGDMPPELQAKLLRVIEDKTFHRVGGTNTIKVDCRIIAATNRHLEAMIQDGRFRKDLYYRLNTVIIRVPALRERMDDLPMLAEHFRLFFLARLGRTIEGFSPAAMDKMAHYAWPGNVRELRNVIERAILLCSSARIEAGDILLGRTLNDAGDANTCVVKLPSDGCNLAEVERDLVRQAMEMAQNNQTRAAQLLAISRDQLRYKLDKFDLPRG